MNLFCRRFIFISAFLFFNLSLPAQSRNEKIRINGYVKYLLTTNFSDGLDNVVTDNLLHHRFNFRYYPVSSLLVNIEVRNRIHYGELVKLTNTFSPLTGVTFGDLIDNNDIYDMSVLLLDKRSLAWHVMLDRAYLRYSKNKWEVVAGRQRINWGVTLIWNPNDIFNAYSFFDFDYEERLGSDAVRVTFFPNTSSSIEIAGKAARKKEDVVAAMMYKWNKARYDFQVLGGVANEDITAGGGWAGNIKNAGFKGEFTYFHPYNNFTDTSGVFSGTVSFDYSFKKNVFINGSFLYTSNGSSNISSPLLSTLDISAKSLSPYKYNFLTNVTYAFTPILTGSLALLYSPGDHALFTNPVLTYSIKEDWDIDVIGQLFFSNASRKYEPLAKLLFMRLRWSY